MKDNKTPFCKVPFLMAFNTPNNQYRDCCMKRPRITSDPSQNFKEWWRSDEINEFRQLMLNTKSFPRECLSCELAEAHQGESFRTAVNKWSQTDYSHPAAWNIIFGNTCNLACWICHEESSSVIFQHKKRAGLVSGQDHTGRNFNQHWPDLRENILKSYEHHETVNLTLLGGEPLYNKTVIGFLNDLIDMGFAHRTRLEFHTNGTVYPSKILPRDRPSPWQHVCMFISLDAAGRYAEWLRYGCTWPHLDKVVDALIESADYTEIHCTLTVLNINQLSDLKSYADSKNCKLMITLTDNPEYMALKSWDLPADRLLVNEQDKQFKIYYDLIGTNPVVGSSQKLVNYIRSFDGVRKPLSEFDQTFAEKIQW